MKSESFDLMCLKALKVNAESERVALAAASIVVHAHAIARDAPHHADGARRIVDLVRGLYATMPSRKCLTEMVDDFLAEVVPELRDRRRAEAARERLVDRMWRHFHHGGSASG